MEALTESFTQLFVTVIGVLIILLQQYKRSISLDGKLDELKVSADQRQDAELIAVISKIEGMEEALNSLVKIHDNEAYVHKLKRRLKDTADRLMEQLECDDVFVSMTIEATNSYYEMMRDVWFEGIENMNANRLKREAQTRLRMIRGPMVGNRVIPQALADKIKQQVAEPLVSEMIVNLLYIKDGNLNGKTPSEYMRVCVDFVQKIISQGYNVYKQG